MPVPADQRRQLTTQQDRTFRHFAGKQSQIVETEWTSESESEDEEEKVEQAKTKPKLVPKELPEGFISAADREERRQEAEIKRKREQEEEAEFDTESEGDEQPGAAQKVEDDESEEESSEEESSSDDEPQNRRKNIVLLSRSQREALDRSNGTMSNTRNRPPVQEDEEWEVQEQRRKARADALLEEQLAAQKLMRENAKKEWDDEDLTMEDDVDDTDPQPNAPDYEIELEAALSRWKLRELHRVKRDRDEFLAREKEIEAIERRRNMTPAERAAEERRKLDGEKDEHDSRGKVAFMQKYFHKGAFYNEELEGAGLAKRDIMGARFQDATDRSLLPQSMQIRDMEKLGKKGHTRYRDMRSEDTGQFGGWMGDRRPPRQDDAWKSKQDRGQPDDRFLDDRFKSDGDDRRGYANGRHGGGDDNGPTGANARPLGERKRFGDDQARGIRDDKRPRVT